jgi:cell filamentation protein
MSRDDIGGEGPEAYQDGSHGLVLANHLEWLGDIYPFAGQLRTVDLSKIGVSFAPAAYLESSVAELDLVLRAHTPCAGKGSADLVESIGIVHGEMIFVHPFREGNGRLARWLADLMAAQADGQILDWRFEEETERRQEEYFAALRKSFEKDYSPLIALVKQALDRGSAM